VTVTAAGDAVRRPGTSTGARTTVGRPTADRPRVVEPRRPRLTYRRDIDGLRAVAVVLVVAFHAGLGVVPGGFVGVDVFFVISGFLITGLLVDELDRSGTVSLPAFYARRMRRLLPLSALVLVVTAMAASVILPPLTHASVADDVRAAAVWVSNWHFAAGSTQYMSDTAQSPVLHYWSLSLEEQFYVVWPLVMLGVVWSVGRWGPMSRRRLGTALGVILAVSLLASMTLTSATGPWAYFGLQTRAWELAVGAGLSLVVVRLTELTLPVAALSGWVGLALIAWAAFTFDRTTAYPGIAAVVPVTGAALVLASGARTRGVGASGLLSHPAAVHVGKLSYSWYLWHWPLLVLAAALAPTTGSDSVDGSPVRTPVLYVLLALALSYVLAEVSHRYVEDPVRRAALFTSSVSRSLTLGAALTVTSVLIANAALGAVDAPPSTATVAPVITTSAGATTVPSAAPSATTVKTLHPMTPAQARLDGAASTTCFVGYAATTADGSCRYGDPQGTKVVALVGDSHAAMWLPALDKVAKAKHWQVRMWAKSACPMTEVGIYLASYKAAYDACTAWRTDVLRRLAEIPHLDLVVVARSKGYVSGLVLDGTGSVVSDSALPAAWRAGTRDLLTRLTSLSRRVVLVRDTPWAFGDVPDCLSAHLSDPTSCAFPRADRQHLDDPMVTGENAAMAGMAHVRMVDPTTLVCPQDTCQVVTPTGVIVYRDGHHLTRTFATTLAAGFGRLLAPSLSG
jgi:peptidoglycan/LPS O-acetylase OafA/YrhL